MLHHELAACDALTVTRNILVDAIADIDDQLAPGYALKNPALIAAYMDAAARVFHGLVLSTEEGYDE